MNIFFCRLSPLRRDAMHSRRERNIASQRSQRTASRCFSSLNSRTIACASDPPRSRNGSRKGSGRRRTHRRSPPREAQRTSHIARAPRCRQRNTPPLFYFSPPLPFLPSSPSRSPHPESAPDLPAVASSCRPPISSQINQTFESRLPLFSSPVPRARARFLVVRGTGTKLCNRPPLSRV